MLPHAPDIMTTLMDHTALRDPSGLYSPTTNTLCFSQIQTTRRLGGTFVSLIEDTPVLTTYRFRLEVLRALIGRIPPNPLWAELLWQRQEELAKQAPLPTSSMQALDSREQQGVLAAGR